MRNGCTLREHNQWVAEETIGADGKRPALEELAHVGNDIEALDRTLISLGFEGDLKIVQPRGNRVVFFARDELRRFLLNELRKADGPISSRDLAEMIIGLEGKDARDRRLRNDMVKRVGKSLKLLRHQRMATSMPGPNLGLVWSIVPNPPNESMRS